MFDAIGYLRDHFSDPDGVINLLAKHSPQNVPERAAVEKWFQRASVPSQWLPLLHIAAEAEGKKHVSFENYVQLGGKHDIFA